MTPREFYEILEELIEKYGYDKVKKTVESMFEFYEIIIDEKERRI